MSEGKPVRRSSFEKVNVDDPEYLEDQETEAKDAENHVYGASLLYRYKQWRNWGNIPQQIKDRIGDRNALEQELVRLAARIDEDFKRFLRPENHDEWKAAYQYLHRGLASSQVARDKTISYFGNDTAAFQSYENDKDDLSRVYADGTMLAKVLHERVKQGSLPWEIWAEIVQANSDEVKALEHKLRLHNFPEVRNEFEQRLPALLAKYGVTDKTAVLMDRIDSVAVNVVDELSSTLDRIHGRYNQESNQILISAEVAEDYDRSRSGETFAHEIFHVISGRLVYKETHTRQPRSGERSQDVQSSFSYKAGRVGLRYDPPREGTGVTRFKWLNEAITEWLTVEFAQSAGHRIKNPSYRDEMIILDYLCNHGSCPIDFSVFVRAYFEDYEPQIEEDEETIPAWRELWAAIEESFGKQYLVKLDRRIRKDGARKVVGELKDEVLARDAQ